MSEYYALVSYETVGTEAEDALGNLIGYDNIETIHRFVPETELESFIEQFDNADYQNFKICARNIPANSLPRRTSNLEHKLAAALRAVMSRLFVRLIVASIPNSNASELAMEAIGEYDTAVAKVE